VRLANCDTSNSNQKWSFDSNGYIYLKDTNICLTSSLPFFQYVC